LKLYYFQNIKKLEYNIKKQSRSAFEQLSIFS